MLLSGEKASETSDAVLELAVLGSVDERVDTAAEEHQNHGEVIEPVGKINNRIEEG